MMTDRTILSESTDRLSPPILPFLLLLFLGGGACALIYEVVWFQLLELVIGSSAISLAVLLTTFMGGMCVGSLAFPKFVPPGWHPLRVYAILELSIGIIGVLELFAIPLVGRLYSPAVATVRPRWRCAPEWPDCACCRPRSSWVRRFRQSLGGWNRHRAGSRGSVSSTAATSREELSGACWPASTSCAYTISRLRPT